MTIADKRLIDDSIIKHGDNFWNDEDEDCPRVCTTNRGWIVEELLELLAEDNLDLKVIRKRK